jgi:poly(beta-D-mannuronate) C5 epimerase
VVRYAIFALGLFLAVSTPAAAFDATLVQARLSALALQDTAQDTQGNAADLKAQFGLITPDVIIAKGPLRPFAAGGAPAVELVDLRLVLAQIAVDTGARDHLILTRAQASPDQPQIILLHGGFASLEEVLDLAAGTAAEAFVSRRNGAVRLTRPLVIWADAGLLLASDDALILDTAAGSFIVNLGRLDIRGAHLSGSASTNKGAPAFRPFLLTAGRGSLSVRDARFAHLGFGKTQRFAGVAVMNAGLPPPTARPEVLDSRFTDVSALSLINTLGAQVRGNRFHDGSVLIVRSRRAMVADNLLTMNTGQGLRVLNGSSQVTLRDNIVIGGDIAISVEQAGEDTVITGNILSRQNQSGIRLEQTDCAASTGNLLLFGTGNGIAVTNTGHIGIDGNVIIGHAGAAIVLRAQGPSAHVRISGNRIADNREGLRGATAGRISLSGNDMDGQMPRLFGGDMAFRTIGWLEARRDLGHPGPLQSDSRPICQTGGKP